jgi:phosphoenolpyruvate carboxykinase (GTP)
VLEWVFRRCEGTADAVETPIGMLPARDAIDTSGLEISEAAMEQLLSVDTDLVKAQLPQVQEHLAKFGDKLPAEVSAQLEALEERLS